MATVGDGVDALLAKSGGARPRVGIVTSVDAPVAMVSIMGGEVPAYITDHVLETVAVGVVVTILPVGDTYEVVSTRTGSAGGGSEVLGPELLPNPDFSFGIPGTVPTNWDTFWTFGPANTIWDDTPGETLSSPGRALVTLVADTAAVTTNLMSTDFAVDEGVTYRTRAWVKASTILPTVTATLYAMTAPATGDAMPFGAGAAPTTGAPVSGPGSAWQTLTEVFTVPTGHTHARLYLKVDGGIGDTLDVSWDSASFRQRISA